MARLELNSESKLTDRYQTTIPETVRKALHLHKRDKLRYSIKANGDVLISRASEDSDPVLDNFLEFLAKDMRNNPQQVVALGGGLASRVQLLLDDVDVDLDAPLSDEDE